MKRIILIKTCAETQIAHLYEHLYCEAIRALFKQHNLFYYIDYTYQGTTYNKGVVHITIDFYTPEAVGLIESLTELSVWFDDKALEPAIAQIVAEEKYYLRSSKKDRLLDQLHELHTQPWQSLDDFTLFDARQHRFSQKTLWLSEEKARVKKLQCDLLLDKNFAATHRSLLPLFDIVGGIIQENLSRELCNKYGYYRNDNPARYTKKSFKTSQELTGWVRYIPKFTDEAVFSKKTLENLLKSDLVERASAFFAKTHYDQAYEAPDELRLFEAMDILIGAKGWRQIGTKENIRRVLQHTTLQLNYGKEKQSFAIASLLR